jgi:cell filamentation protein
VVSATTQFKFLAPDGKNRFADMLDYAGIIALGKTFPGRKANCFIEMFMKGIDYSYYYEEQ